MKRKQVEKMLIEKANLVEVPDITTKLKDRFNEIPPKRETVHVYKRYRLVGATALSIAVLLIVAFLTIFNTPEQDPFMTVEDDNTLYEAVMLSAISTVSVIDDLATVSAEDQVILLAFGPPTNNDEDPEEDTVIEDSIGGLRHYLGLMENILSSENNYRYQHRVMNRRQRQYAIDFETDSLTREAVDYELEYQVTTDTDNQTHLEAVIKKGTTTYQSNMTYDKQTQAITMKTAYQQNQSVEIRFYRDQDRKHYDITTYQGIDIVEQVELSYQTSAHIALTFTHGQAFGTYDFSIINHMGMRRLSIDYDIQDRFQGNINISVTGTDNDIYEMEITPQGRPSFTITRDRGRDRN